MNLWQKMTARAVRRFHRVRAEIYALHELEDRVWRDDPVGALEKMRLAFPEGVPNKAGWEGWCDLYQRTIVEATARKEGRSVPLRDSCSIEIPEGMSWTDETHAKTIAIFDEARRWIEITLQFSLSRPVIITIISIRPRIQDDHGTITNGGWTYPLKELDKICLSTAIWSQDEGSLRRSLTCDYAYIAIAHSVMPKGQPPNLRNVVKHCPPWLNEGIAAFLMMHVTNLDDYINEILKTDSMFIPRELLEKYPPEVLDSSPYYCSANRVALHTIVKHLHYDARERLTRADGTIDLRLPYYFSNGVFVACLVDENKMEVLPALLWELQHHSPDKAFYRTTGKTLAEWNKRFACRMEDATATVLRARGYDSSQPPMEGGHLLRRPVSRSPGRDL